MKSFIAALRTLVLPFGATSGRRIILNGVDGTIEVYDAADTLVALIDEDGIWAIENDGSYVLMTNNGSFGAELQLQPNDVPGLVYGHGNVYATTFPGQDNVPVSVIGSPRITSPFSGDFARIYVLGEDDALNPPMIDLRATGETRVLDGDFHAFQNATFDNDVSIADDLIVGNRVFVDGSDIGRGHVAGSYDTANSAATAGPNTAAVLIIGNTLYDANRAYAVKHSAQGMLSTAITNNLLLFELRKGLLSTSPLLTQLGRTPLISTLATGFFQEVYFTTGANAVTTPLTLSMTVPTGANGTHVGSANLPRSISIYDVGAATDFPDAPVLT